MTGVLLDRRLGVLLDVARLPTPPGLPAGWVSYGAAVSRTDRFAGWTADPYGFGAALGDERRARGAAIGEAVERYCGNAVPDGLPRRSADELAAAGADPVDPATVALYSPAQYATPGFPFRPFTRDLQISWVPGTDLVTGAEVHVPASMAYLDHHHGPRTAEPPLHSLLYAGIATARTRERAEQAALEELVERDATAIWWQAGGPVTGLDDAGRVTGLLGRPARDRPPLHTRFLAVPHEFGLPVVAALVQDDARRLIGFGAACRSRPAEAAAKALVEALGLLRLADDLDRRDSDVWRAVDVGRVPAHTYLPHRADRRYLDDTGPQHRRLVDLPGVAQLYLDPRAQRVARDRLTPADVAGLDTLPAVTGDPRAVYLERLTAAGCRVVSIDLTTPDVALAGLRVVRVIATGLIGNGPPAFPLRGGRRLTEVPVRLGWRRTPPADADLFDLPLPLA